LYCYSDITSCSHFGSKSTDCKYIWRMWPYKTHTNL